MAPQVTSQTTLLKGGTIIAFDGHEHRTLEDGVLAYRGDRILHVGTDYAAPVDRVIDTRGKLVIPGQISCHAHVSANEGHRPLVDGGRRDFMRSGFLSYIPTKGPGGRSMTAEADLTASIRYGIASLIRHGVTTAVAFNGEGGPDQAIVRLAGEMGIRLYFAPAVRGGTHHFDGDGRLHRTWDEAGGLAALERAGAAIERIDSSHDGRVRGIVIVDEFYLSTPPLRRAAKALADRLGVNLTMHFCEQHYEFFETVRETGKTPAELLAAEGVLGPGVILAHSIYLSGSSYTGHHYSDDVGLIGRAGAAVAHSPLVFARRGTALESFQRYLDAGITMALGTDVYPMDLIEEMRTATMVGKIVDKNHEVATAAAVFAASNLGGATALRRDDIGRLSAGAKADIVILDFDNLQIGPVADPIRSLVHCATSSMIETVIVDGRTLMDGGRLLVCDERAVLAEAKASCEAVWSSYGQFHFAGRSLAQDFPPALKRWGD